MAETMDTSTEGSRSVQNDRLLAHEEAVGYLRVPMSPDDLRAYSVTEAAEMLNLSVVQLRRIISRGEIRVKRTGKRILVPATALRDFLES